jgi:hypothetical protein
VSDFFNVHTAFTGGDEGHLLRGAIGHDGEVILLLDVCAIFNVEATHFLAFGAGLVRFELHAQNVASAGFHVINALGDFHAAALTTATRMNLRLDHPNRAA